MDTIETGRRRRNIGLGIFFIAYLTASWVFPPVALFIPVCMMIGVAFAFTSGRRLWCGKICPRGNFLEMSGRAMKPGAATPSFMSTPRFRYGLLVVLMGWMMGMLYRLWPDYAAIERFLAVLLTITTAVAVILAIRYRPRAWCGICPIGTIASAKKHG